MPSLSQTGRAPHWLLDLNIGGRVLRYSDSDLIVTDQSGRSLVYHGCLGDGLAVSLTYGKGSPSQAAIQIVDPDQDWALLVARGEVLELASGVLRYWYEGQILEQAREVLRGDLRSPVYDRAGLPFEFTLARIPWEEGSVIPEPNEKVSDFTWPVRTPKGAGGYGYDESALDASYPIPLGRPGRMMWSSSAIASAAPGSPAYLVEYIEAATLWITSRLLIALGEVEATSVIVHDMSDNVSGTLDVVTSEDLLGVRVSYAQFQSAPAASVSAALRPVLGHEYWVEWYAGGGIYDLEHESALTRAGEVILWLLSRYYSADVGRCQAQRAWLDWCLIDAVIQEATDVSRWINRELVPILPISYAEGTGGAYYVVWRYDATPADAVRHLSVDTGQVERKPGIEWSDDEIYNEIVLEYGQSLGQTLKQITARETPGGRRNDRPGPIQSSDGITMIQAGTAFPDPTGDEDGGYLAQTSMEREGVKRLTVSTQVIADDATAHQILRLLMLRHSVRRRIVTYSGTHADLGDLELGDVVTITDSEVYLDGNAALIQGVRLSLTGVQVVLEILDHPAQSSRRTT